MVHRNTAFTLAEVLIALALLGVIAAFTIPKVLSSNNTNQMVIRAHSAAAMLSGAYQTYKSRSAPTASTGLKDIIMHMNVDEVKNAIIDGPPVLAPGPTDCAYPGYICYRLKSGGILQFGRDAIFNGEQANNVIPVNFDPDGQLSNLKSVCYLLYFDGALKTAAFMRPNSTGMFFDGIWGPFNPNPAYDPSWFHW